MRLKTNVIIAAACISIQSMAHNPNDPDSLSVEPIRLRDINVVRRVNHLSEISKVDLAVNPVKSSQEILRSVPGLFIAQHAGGGKAEQMFLRGFDLDHGTDINISVDGMPVNMVSHAHGQGYADLYFLSPDGFCCGQATGTDREESLRKRSFASQSDKVICLVEPSKEGRVAPFEIFCPAVTITEKGISSK